MIGAVERHRRFTVVSVPEALPFENSNSMHNAAISRIAARAQLDNNQLFTIDKARELFFSFGRDHCRLLKAPVHYASAPGRLTPRQRLPAAPPFTHSAFDGNTILDDAEWYPPLDR